ncbi:hypothetical protein GW756_01740 [bacterium]|nr:hypothetical protein [bacterium]NCQ55077.1 hypothetical protein [Candidatus Parcubacteria bacterium]NCS67121.1 hypothetical protein [Candidatus Peregrinibacteria bacterium]NCS96067.1 hypothetical protein [bacterium]
MKNLRSIGFILMASSFFSVSFAANSALMDEEAGLATDIVETNNIIQVYQYEGMSSESGPMMSTFNEGEDWTNVVIPPATTQRFYPFSMPVSSWVKNQFRVDTGMVSGMETIDYVEMIDSCTEAGNYWNYKTDACESN